VKIETKPFTDVALGLAATFAKTVSESDVYGYAGITGDFSPNHINAEYMREGAYGERLAHGALLIGFMSAAGALLKLGRTVSQGYDRVRFLKGVRFGDTITTRYEITRIDAEKKRCYAEVACLNQHGETVAVATHIRALVG
jgi:acyl dehydratase